MKVELNNSEIILLLEALRKAASRHESESRYSPRAAKPHDAKAAAMRKLFDKLAKASATTAAA